MTTDLRQRRPRITPMTAEYGRHDGRAGRYPPPSERYRVPDELWAKIWPVVRRLDPPKHLGRKRIDPRAALDAIIYRMLTDCPWNRLPDSFPDDSAIHRTYQRWKASGLLSEIWSILLAEQRSSAKGGARENGGQPRAQAG